jgi:hypothetical protein
MPKRRAIIDFAGIALAPVTVNTLAGYTAGTPVEVPFAGTMNRTVKEQNQDIYYDGELYAQVRDITGEDVEIRVGEVSLELLEDLGLGVFDEETDTLEANFAPLAGEHSLRCVTGTVDELPWYFNWRLFELNGIRFDNFQSKGGSIQVCEVIISGVLKKPRMVGLKPYVIGRTKDDGSNEAALRTMFLTTGETKPSGD